ncbi:MAG: glycine cleavage system aminomethyltransferase GcvT [Desulfonatronovibrio sp.]
MDHIKTPLSQAHKKLSARMGPFAGWEMPIQYQGIIAEHNHTRSKACLFDICHMGELLVTGKNAAMELDRLVTHDLENAVPGKCSYGFILNPGGGILDDLIIYPLQEDKFLLVVNASQKQDDLDHLKDNLSSGVKVLDQTMQTGKLDLQGPESLYVLEKITGGKWGDLKYFNFRQTTLAGLDILVSRTGYTGELGYELYIPWDRVEKIWDMILADERVKPAGLGARDTLRLEAGLPLYGQELDQHHTPAEAGYEFVLKSKSRYLGKDRAFSVKKRLTGLHIEGRRSPRAGDKVLAQDRPAGLVTSGSFAPSLGHCLAFAYIDRQDSELTEFFIQRDKVLLKATKAVPPFYQGTARINTSRLSGR